MQPALFLDMASFPSSSPSMLFKCACRRIFNFQPYHWAIASNNLIPNNRLGSPPPRQPSSIAQIAKPGLSQSRSDKTWCQWSYWRGRCPEGIPPYTSSFCKAMTCWRTLNQLFFFPIMLFPCRNFRVAHPFTSLSCQVGHPASPGGCAWLS